MPHQTTEYIWQNVIIPTYPCLLNISDWLLRKGLLHLLNEFWLWVFTEVGHGSLLGNPHGHSALNSHDTAASTHETQFRVLNYNVTNIQVIKSRVPRKLSRLLSTPLKILQHNG